MRNKPAKPSMRAEIHFHPELLEQLKHDLEEASRQTDAARRLKVAGHTFKLTALWIS
jgi:hypothetical protein